MKSIKSEKIFQTKVKLIKNIEVSPNYYKMVLDAPQIARSALPGQFVNIRVSDRYRPLLRRPFSIHRIRDSKIEILYEIIGRGTQILSQRKTGEKLDVLGPLGRGFDLDSKQDVIIVAGGMGVAPLIFLAEKLAKHKAQSTKHKTLVLIGAKNKKQILCKDEFENLDCEIKIATDDGSLGFKGFVTSLLKRYLSLKNKKPQLIFACGPKQMLKEIANISKKYRIPAQISLEEHMACGIGACLGCVVQTKSGYKRVCKEGPVFDTEELKL